MNEFEDACELLAQHLDSPIAPQHVKDLAKSIDINHDGVIDFNEFLEAFRLVDRSMTAKEEEDSDDLLDIIPNAEEMTFISS